MIVGKREDGGNFGNVSSEGCYWPYGCIICCTRGLIFAFLVFASRERCTSLANVVKKATDITAFSYTGTLEEPYELSASSAMQDTISWDIWESWLQISLTAYLTRCLKFCLGVRYDRVSRAAINTVGLIVGST